MNGQRFVAELEWPPPSHLYGPDIHHTMIGTYELRALYEDRQMAEYVLRVDGNFREILGAWIKIRARRALEGERT